MTVNFDLFKGDLKSMVEHLEKQKSKMEKFSNQLTDDVAQDMVENIKINANVIGGMSGLEEAQSVTEMSSTLDKVASLNQIDSVGLNHKKIWNLSEEATYAEFGTGMMGEGTPHPLGNLGWQYDVNAHGDRGWRYIGQGGLLVHTLGYPAFSTYYNSFNDTKDDLPKIAKLTFTEVFGSDD